MADLQHWMSCWTRPPMLNHLRELRRHPNQNTRHLPITKTIKTREKNAHSPYLLPRKGANSIQLRISLRLRVVASSYLRRLGLAQKKSTNGKTKGSAYDVPGWVIDRMIARRIRLGNRRIIVSRNALRPRIRSSQKTNIPLSLSGLA